MKIVTALHMELLSYILGAFVNVGFIALIIIFQPEVRRFLLGIGNTKISLAFKNLIANLGFRYKEEKSLDLDAICEACASMSQDKVGALILLAQENNLNEIIETGVTINAVISKPLIETFSSRIVLYTMAQWSLLTIKSALLVVSSLSHKTSTSLAATDFVTELVSASQKTATASPSSFLKKLAASESSTQEESMTSRHQK